MAEPVKIFSDTPKLNCEICGKNLLEDGNVGNYIVFRDDAKYRCIKFACKEHDHIVTQNAVNQNLQDEGWEDINDMKLPTIWIKRLMAFANEMHTTPDQISDQYFNDFKHLFLNTFPYIVREMNEQEQDRISQLLMFDF